MLKPRHTSDEKIEIGIDEAGRGCLWGPLVAAAVILPREEDWSDEFRAAATHVRDSKKLSPTRRAAMNALIRRCAMSWGVGEVTPAEIDTHGMTWANRMAFQRAVADAVLKRGSETIRNAPRRLLIDGVLGLTQESAEGAEQIVEPQGDGTYMAVAAASIVAKEHRDGWVREQVVARPELGTRYGLAGNKGYAATVHRDGIKAHGMDVLHRRLFLRKLLGASVHSGFHKEEEGPGFIDE